MLITNLTLETKIITTGQEFRKFHYSEKNSSLTMTFIGLYNLLLMVRLYCVFIYLTNYFGTSRYTSHTLHAIDR